MPIVKIYFLLFSFFVLSTASGSPVQSLEEWLSVDRSSRKPIQESEFSKLSLSEEEEVRAGEFLWKDHVEMIRETRSKEMKAKDDLTLNEGLGQNDQPEKENTSIGAIS